MTVSNIGCSPGTVQVFDSMANKDLPPNAKSQIAAIMCVKDQNIVLQFVSVQKQHGDSDCGVFAIAFATSLCTGHNPAERTYMQDRLRPHLCQCLEERVFTEFPYEARKIEQLRNSVVIPVYSECRQPERENMVQCDQCQEWFHDDCVTVPNVIGKGDNVSWLCKACSIGFCKK